MLASAAFFLLALGAAARPMDARDAWQDDDSPVVAMFKRAAPSPSDANFTSNYPPSGATPPNSTIPQAWIDKLASITLPTFGPSNPNNGYPTYANGESPSDSTICSFTYACTTSDDLYNPPDGVLALTFDDGPGPSSSNLYDFLKANNASSKATHFMIGGNILNTPTTMQRAASEGGLIAVHTWSHPYMTSKSNMGVLAELGWTMQIISDLNGGRLPKFWRPPYGDVDNRVRAIAKGVFGLETVPWNHDSADWAIGTGSYTNASQFAQVSGWLNGTKSPGICMLEHELNPNEVGLFEAIYPEMVSNGWDVKNVADAWNMDWYQNSGNSNTEAVTSMAVAAGTFAASGSSNATSTSTMANSTTMASSSTSMVSSTSAGSAPTTSNTASTSTVVAAASATTTSKTAGALSTFRIPSSGVLAGVLGLVLIML